MAGFFDTALETRLQIYRNLLHERPIWARGHCVYGFNPALLRVNKQISAEAATVLYGENIWQHKLSTIEYSRDMGKYLSTSLWIHSLLRSSNLRKIRFEFCFTPKETLHSPWYVCEALSEAPALRAVGIAWSDQVYFHDKSERWFLPYWTGLNYESVSSVSEYRMLRQRFLKPLVLLPKRATYSIIRVVIRCNGRRKTFTELEDAIRQDVEDTMSRRGERDVAKDVRCKWMADSASETPDRICDDQVPKRTGR